MADEFDSGFELLPADEAEITPDEELEALLSEPPVTDEEEIEDTPVPLGRGWSFDFETGQFHRHGYSPSVAYGTENLKIWIQKTLLTARFAHPIYPDDYGVEWPEPVIGQRFTPELAGKAGQVIEDALLFHDRITQVKDFKFATDPLDTLLEVSFTVVLDEDELIIEDLPIPRTVP